MTDKSPQPGREQERDPKAQQPEPEPTRDDNEIFSAERNNNGKATGEDKYSKNPLDNSSPDLNDIAGDGAKSKTQSSAGHVQESDDVDEDSEEEDEEDEEDDEEDEDDDDEEPRLKYARLTQHLGGVYRNGDATSAFLVAGDKMVRNCFESVTKLMLTRSDCGIT